MRLHSRCFGVSVVFVLVRLVVLAQPAMPTTNVLTRVLMVQSQYGRASIFSIDVDQREYWVTAKHVLNGRLHPPYGVFAERSVALKILNPGGEGEQWLSENFSVIDPGEDIDIVVLAPPTPLLTNPIPSLATGSEGLFLGGDCEFLGFPYGGGWRAGPGLGSVWWPFVKHCTVSATLNNAVDSKRIWVLDGINNEGFSGGPVIFGTGPAQRIFAVVSGYHTEPVEVVPYAARLYTEKKRREQPSSQPVDNSAHNREKVDVNSGFIIAFDVNYAVDAIKKNPIGPLRTAK